MRDIPGLEGVVIRVSVGAGHTLCEAASALALAKEMKHVEQLYNIVVYNGRPLDDEDLPSEYRERHKAVGAVVEAHSRLMERARRRGDVQDIEDLMMIRQDAMTGLMTRVGYELEVQKLKGCGNYAGRVIMLMDGDNMKETNARIGYKGTDVYLAAMGRALRSQLRMVDDTKHPDRNSDIVLINRMNGSGGDEFVIDVGCSYRFAQVVAQRFVRAVYDAQKELSHTKYIQQTAANSRTPSAMNE